MSSVSVTAMNTFLPYPNLTASAAVLDPKRLHNQLNECVVILAALEGAKAWNRHPATLMWAGYLPALRSYAGAIADELRRRGMPTESELTQFEAPMPWWFGDNTFHSSHRANLKRKDPNHYGFFPEEPSDVYAWPWRHRIYRLKQVNAKNYRGFIWRAQ